MAVQMTPRGQGYRRMSGSCFGSSSVSEDIRVQKLRRRGREGYRAPDVERFTARFEVGTVALENKTSCVQRLDARGG